MFGLDKIRARLSGLEHDAIAARQRRLDLQDAINRLESELADLRDYLGIEYITKPRTKKLVKASNIMWGPTE